MDGWRTLSIEDPGHKRNNYRMLDKGRGHDGGTNGGWFYVQLLLVRPCHP